MRRIFYAALALLLAASTALAQVPYFPQTLPAGTVVGRMPTAGSGPTEAIPFSVIVANLGPVTKTISVPGQALGQIINETAVFNYTGGTPGFVSNTQSITTTVTSGVTDYIWGFLSVMNNAAISGNQVALYGRSNKQSTSATWGGVFETHDQTHTNDPVAGLYGGEIDIVANGTDANLSRRGLDIIGFRDSALAADAVFGWGAIVESSVADVGHVKFNNGYVCKGNGASPPAFDQCINLSQATYNVAGMLVGTDVGIALDNAATYTLGYSSLQALPIATLKSAGTNAVVYPWNVQAISTGTPAIGIGSGIRFIAPNNAGTGKQGAFVAAVETNVTPASETFNLQFGLMNGGAAAATTLALTPTTLTPQVSSALDLGTSSLFWGTLWLHSAIEFDNGDAAWLHTSHLITQSNSLYAINPNVNATGATFTTYALQITDNAAVAAISLGWDGTQNVLQSWNNHTLSINPQANAVAFPSAATTASAANAFLNNASSPVNQLQRSTSSVRYKTKIADVTMDEAEHVLKLRGISYQSLAPLDDPTKRWYGFTAEQANDIDPRLVQFDGKGRPDGVAYDRVPVLMLTIIKDLRKRVKELEDRRHAHR